MFDGINNDVQKTRTQPSAEQRQRFVLYRRINRILAKRGQRLVILRKAVEGIGTMYIKDVTADAFVERNVNLEELAGRLNVNVLANAATV